MPTRNHFGLFKNCKHLGRNFPQPNLRDGSVLESDSGAKNGISTLSELGRFLFSSMIPYLSLRKLKEQFIKEIRHELVEVACKVNMYTRKRISQVVSHWVIVAWTMLEQHCYHAWATLLDQQYFFSIGHADQLNVVQAGQLNLVHAGQLNLVHAGQAQRCSCWPAQRCSCWPAQRCSCWPAQRANQLNFVQACEQTVTICRCKSHTDRNKNAQIRMLYIRKP